MADPTGSTQPDVPSTGHPQPAVRAEPQAPAPKVLLDDLDSAFDFANRSLDEYTRYGSVGITWG